MTKSFAAARASRRLAAAAGLISSIIIAAASAQAPAQQDPGRQAADDPAVKRCVHLATRRQDPKLDPTTTVLEQAMYLLQLTPVIDAVASCRAAGAAYPNDRRVIIGDSNAVDALSLVLFGLKDYPATDEEAFRRMLPPADTEIPKGAIGDAFLFFIASSYDYGAGVTADKTQAAKWYRKAAERGERISMRELSRLLAAGDGGTDRAEAAHWLLAAVKAGDQDLRHALVEECGAPYDETMRAALQRELVKEGALTGAATGTFDAATTAAVEAFARK